MIDAVTVRDQVITEFDREAGNAATLAVPVKRGVERLPRIRLIVAWFQAFGGQPR